MSDGEGLRTRGDVAADVLTTLAYHGIIRLDAALRADTRDWFEVTDADLKASVVRRFPARWSEVLDPAEPVEGGRFRALVGPPAGALDHLEGPSATDATSDPVTSGNEPAHQVGNDESGPIVMALGPAVEVDRAGPVEVIVERPERYCPGSGKARGHRVPDWGDGSPWCPEHRPRQKRAR